MNLYYHTIVIMMMIVQLINLLLSSALCTCSVIDHKWDTCMRIVVCSFRILRQDRKNRTATNVCDKSLNQLDIPANIPFTNWVFLLSPFCFSPTCYVRYIYIWFQVLMAVEFDAFVLDVAFPNPQVPVLTFQSFAV